MISASSSSFCFFCFALPLQQRHFALSVRNVQKPVNNSTLMNYRLSPFGNPHPQFRQAWKHKYTMASRLPWFGVKCPLVLICVPISLPSGFIEIKPQTLATLLPCLCSCCFTSLCFKGGTDTSVHKVAAVSKSQLL